MRRLEAAGLPETAIPIWIRERERRRLPLGAEDEATEDARHDLMSAAADFILRAPCSCSSSGAAILQAVLDPEIGLFSCDVGQNDEPALQRVAAFLEASAGDQPAARGERAAPATSSLVPMLAEALAAEAAADETGYSDDGEVWLGASYDNRRDALLDAVNLAPCTSTADVLAKLDAILLDMDATGEHLDAAADCVTASLALIRAFMADEPAPDVGEARTRRQVYEARGLPYEGERSPLDDRPGARPAGSA